MFLLVFHFHKQRSTSKTPNRDASCKPVKNLLRQQEKDLPMTKPAADVTGDEDTGPSSNKRARSKLKAFGGKVHANTPVKNLNENLLFSKMPILSENYGERQLKQRR